MPKKPNKTYPEKVVLGGIPFTIGGHPFTGTDRRNVSRHDYTEQKITISEGLPYPRWLSYLSSEIALLLLETAGVSCKNSESVARHVGPVLYRLIRENKFDWIYADEVGEPPTTVFVNGLPYVLVVSAEADTYLEDRDLIGEVDYCLLLIRLHSSLKAETRATVFLHEVAHALLYEARCLEIHNKESLIEPLSNLLFQLFKQNDFSFAYNGE